MGLASLERDMVAVHPVVHVLLEKAEFAVVVHNLGLQPWQTVVLLVVVG